MSRLPWKRSPKRMAAAGATADSRVGGDHRQQVAGPAGLRGDVGMDPRRTGQLGLHRRVGQRGEDQQADPERDQGVADPPRDRPGEHRRQHDHRHHRQQPGGDQDLLPDQQLGRRHQAEGRPEEDRRAPLADYDLVDEHEQQRREEHQDQVRVVGMGDHERREAVDQPAGHGRALGGHVAADGQVPAPRRQAVAQGEQHVEAEHGPEGQGQGRQQQPGQWHPGVPHQVDATRVVEPVAVEGRDVTPHRERRPAQEPGEHARIAEGAAEGPGRRRRPGPPQQQYRQPQEAGQGQRRDQRGPQAVRHGPQRPVPWPMGGLTTTFLPSGGRGTARCSPRLAGTSRRS